MHSEFIQTFYGVNRLFIRFAQSEKSVDRLSSTGDASFKKKNNKWLEMLWFEIICTCMFHMTCLPE